MCRCGGRYRGRCKLVYTSNTHIIYIQYIIYYYNRGGAAQVFNEVVWGGWRGGGIENIASCVVGVRAFKYAGDDLFFCSRVPTLAYTTMRHVQCIHNT